VILLVAPGQGKVIIWVRLGSFLFGGISPPNKEIVLCVLGVSAVKDYRRIADYIWELDNTGLTISRISSKRYGKERVVRLGVPINIITRILERLENG
jgi:hypothetical protein